MPETQKQPTLSTNGKPDFYHADYRVYRNDFNGHYGNVIKRVSIPRQPFAPDKRFGKTDKHFTNQLAEPDRRLTAQLSEIKKD